MAIIKCPECGHEISDKAPFCPSCGVPIAGKVVSESTETVDSKDDGIEQCTNNENVQPSHNNKIIIGVVLAIVALVVGIGCYFYFSIQSDKELQAYNFAMASKDSQVLQSYLDQYPNAPEEHLDSIQAHLDILKKADFDWTNALISNSKSALEQYVTSHPDSPYKAIAMHKIDSIDWEIAQQNNTVEAFELYLEQHSEGEHVDEANRMISSINSRTIQPEDRLMISSIFNGFFKSLSDKDEDALTSFVNPLLANFLGKPNATKSDVVTFMHKIYKSDVKSMTWQLLDDYAINKKEVGAQQTEYAVTFSAIQTVVSQDNNTNEVKYKISAKLNNDGRIYDFNMIKLVE